MRWILTRWAALAIGMAIAAGLLPGFSIEKGVLSFLTVALVYGLVNSLLGPIVRLFTLPLTFATLGLFALVVNGALLALATWLTPLIEIDGFINAVIAALVISILSAIITFLFDRLSFRSADRAES
jgi:putative membrane protein